MLVISRRPGESFQIGDAIEVKVIAVHDNKVRVGILAPPAQKVRRCPEHTPSMIPPQAPRGRHA